MFNYKIKKYIQFQNINILTIFYHFFWLSSLAFITNEFWFVLTLGWQTKVCLPYRQLRYIMWKIEKAFMIFKKGNPSHSPIGKHFPNSKYENVKNKQIQIFIFAPAGTKILDLFDSEHPYLESRKSMLREFTLKSDFILMATDVSAFL